MELSARIQALAAALEIGLASDRAAKLASFAALVRSWNARMNLTAAREDEALVEVLFADALVLADEGLTPRDARVVDVGSGAGAPAIPLALLRDDLDVTMVEPLRKRVTFLRTAIGTLSLASRARVIEARVEPGRARDVRGAPFEVALSRATLAPAEWLRLGLELAPRVLVLTATDAPEPPAGVVREAEVRYALPSTGASRHICRFSR